MYEYLHRITEDLQQQQADGYWPKNDPELERLLEETDPRLVEIEKKGLTQMLTKKPKELTKKLMADFLGVTPGTLKQELKKQKKHPSSFPPPKR